MKKSINPNRITAPAAASFARTTLASVSVVMNDDRAYERYIAWELTRPNGLETLREELHDLERSSEPNEHHLHALRCAISRTA